MLSGCAPGPPARWSATGLPRRPRWARSCARSPGARCANWTASPARCSPGPGPRAPARDLAVDHRGRLDPLPDLRAGQAGCQQGDRHGERGYHPLLARVAGAGDVLHSRLREPTANTGRGAGGLWPRRSTGPGGPAPAGRSRSEPTPASTTTRSFRPAAGRCRLLDHGQGQQGGPRRHRRDPPGRLDTDSLLAGGRRRRGRDRLPAVWPQRSGHAPDRAPSAPHPRLPARPVLRLRLPPVHHRPPGTTLELEADHRRHAEVENTIRDLKYGVGLNHLPSGRFAANAAWLALNVIAHNLARWTSRLGLGETLITPKALRTRYLDLPGRLTRSARRWRLHLPT